jgi:hypothetical protein
MGYNVYYCGEIQVSPPLSKEHADLVLAFSKGERTELTEAIYESIAGSADTDLPDYAGLFELSDDRSMILPDESESRHGLRLWLELLIEHILEPLGYKLNGTVSWTADDDDDRGTIFVKDNDVETIDDVIFNEGPSWAPEHYVDDRLKKVLHELVDSVDNTGCTPDLTVVAAAPVEAIRQALAQI